jgi:hypothetical protein
MMKTSHRKFKTSYVELILYPDENESGNESEHESEGEHEDENEGNSQLLLLEEKKSSYLQLMKKDGSESDHENEDGDENENDEIEDKQYRNRLSIDTKTDDAKSKNALNRLRFIKLKS